MAKEESSKKNKRPTAEKRMLQNAKKRVRNRLFKSRIKTAIRSFEQAISKKDKQAPTQLNQVYSMLDKGVKIGVVKKNQAARLKSKYASR